MVAARMNATASSSRVWFITGSSGGLGRALASAALTRGDRVVATSRQPENLGDLVAAHPETCRAVALDTHDPASIQAAIEKAVNVFGAIDVLVNNAGGAVFGAVEELDDAEIARNLELNFLAPLRLTRAVLPHMRARRRGHIISLSAAAVLGNYPGFSAYGAAKAALETAMESLAQEARPFGIGVTLVQPGPFRTGFLERSTGRAAARIDDYAGTSGKFLSYLGSIAGKQPGSPDGAARAILAVADAERPPLRLVLGKYAIDKARRRLVTAGRELDAWAEAGTAADFPAGS
jgi:NAD(P)-dependent dehydrogenase (short-subunit alcohol dehydrogenase family)